MEEQKKLLALERDAEVEEASCLRSKTSLKDLCDKGVAIQKLVVDGVVTGLYGKTVITFTNRIVGQDIPAHSLSSGDIVEVKETNNDTAEAKDYSGVVTNVKQGSIAVAFSESGEEIQLHGISTYNLIKLANDVTYKRLKSALDFLASGPTSPLLNVLFGVCEPSTPHQTFHPKLIDSNEKLQFLNQNLDQSQREAVEFCLKQREIGIVHGPPGTGKTTTIVELIRQSVKAEEKVLVCAPSNVAVDNLVERLAREKVKVVRLGHPARVSSELQKHSLDAIISFSDEGQLVRDIYKELDQTLARCRKGEARQLKSEVKVLRKELRMREQKALKEILKRAEVVLGTLTSSGVDSPLRHLPPEHFHLTVIDECSQALETACWIVAGGAKKLVLAGDHLQLPPTIISKDAAKGLGLTLMERIVNKYESKVTRMLTTQYRMNSLIMGWSSHALYSDRLLAAPSVKNHKLSDLSKITKSEITDIPLMMIDTAGCSMEEISSSTSKANEGEAALVCHHIDALIKSGLDEDDIAVITPYNLQVELLRLNIRPRFANIEIKSVDGYQGREKEAVVLSLVRSNNKGEVGFLGEIRRLNVAVTRARRHIVIICDSETVKKDRLLSEFLEFVEQNGEVRSANMYNDLPSILRPDGLELSSVDDGTIHLPLQKKAQRTLKEKKPEVRKKKEVPLVVVSCDKKKYPVAEPQEVSLEDQDKRRDEFKEKIESFFKSQDGSLHFSSDLNSYERRIIHEIAEEFGLLHESIGDGKNRHIQLRKSTLEACREVEKSKSIYSETPSVSVQSDEKTNCNETKCSNCGKLVPKSNIELHKIRCTRPVILNEEVKVPKEGKKSKKAKQKENRNDEDDFDQLCASFQKLDKICNFPKCKALVATLGVNCSFCLLRFCLTHSMAEIHGCGDKAKQAARQQISAEGRIVPGSGRINHKPDKDKRDQLARRLEKKVTGLEGQRKPKKK